MELNRRDFMALLGAALMVPSCGQTKRPPNILFIMADDMGWADLSCYGSRAIETPNIDRLAAEGMRFTDAYSACPVCAPARSCLMTGTHMGHTSVRLNTGGAPLLDSDRTVADVLHDAGYAVGGFGKWGLGELGTEGVPERHGFDEFFGYYHQIHAHYHLPDYLIRNSKKEMLAGNNGFYDDFPHMRYSGGFPRKERAFAPDLIFEETKRFIHENSDRPFFCYAPWTPPHGEYLMPDDDPAWQKYADREDWPVRARVVAAYNTLLDRHVGGLLDVLKELGIAEETVVFFCSDNGADEDYDGALDSSGPLRGKKRSLYEGGIRVPLIARWPGKIPASTVSNHACYFPDILPTLADLAGAQAPEGIDGISFLPTLLNRGEQRVHDYLYWEWERYDWGARRLVPDGLMQAVRAGRWKAVRLKPDAPIELYDLDLGERNDVAGDHPDVVERLEQFMKEAHLPMRPQEEPPRIEGRSFR